MNDFEFDRASNGYVIFHSYECALEDLTIITSLLDGEMKHLNQNIHPLLTSVLHKLRDMRQELLNEFPRIHQICNEIGYEPPEEEDDDIRDSTKFSDIEEAIRWLSNDDDDDDAK
ncbi:MAG: hypothetical protein QXI19_03545 [Candidatus Caldarchaeum sp.]